MIHRHRGSWRPSATRLIPALAACLVSCSSVEDPKTSHDDGPPSPDQEAWGFSWSVTRDGRPRAAIHAEHFTKWDKTRTRVVDGGVTVYFSDAAGRDTVSTLTADRAQIDEATEEVMALGRVLLISTDSTHLETDTLVWNRTTDLITGGGPVTIRRPDGVETGIGFEATSDLEQWTMHQVSTRLQRQDSLR